MANRANERGENAMVMDLHQFQEYCQPAWRDWALEAIKVSIEESRSDEFYTPAARRILKPRSVASVRSDHINHHAERLIVETPDIGIVPRTIGDRAFYLLGDWVVLSFKKLNQDLLPHSNETRQAHAFLHQMPLPGLDAVKGATNIIAGYTVNVLETSIQIHFTCPLGEKNLWVWKLWDTEEAANFLDIVPTVPTSGMIVAPRAPLVRVKPGAREKQEADGSEQ